LRIDVLTLFPGMFSGFLSESMVRIAQEKGRAEIHLTDFRGYAENKWGRVDDRPYGGGPGMVLCCGPVFRAVEDLLGADLGEAGDEAKETSAGLRKIMLCPQGRKLDQALLADLAKAERLVLLCGHYEGYDERIRDGLGFEEVSIGDYVLSGGEPGAMVLIDGVCRLLEGVLGDEDSTKEESFSESLLEYPQYTRPPVYRDMAVPEVLLSGHHGDIAEWRREQAIERTRARRPDLITSAIEQEERDREQRKRAEAQRAARNEARREKREAQRRATQLAAQAPAEEETNQAGSEGKPEESDT
jgi:tRNA (guanine37-N1)-methyltransferase